MALEDMIVCDVDCCSGNMRIDISKILGDRKAFAEAADALYGMFDREMFDIVIASDKLGSVFAPIVANRTKRGIAKTGCPGSITPSDKCVSCGSCADRNAIALPAGTVKEGTKAVIVCDRIANAKVLKDIIDCIENLGGKVIKIGALAENGNADFRKTVLKGYPLESMFILKH